MIEYMDYFRILEELKRENGSVVYLAEDPRLNRQVAIQTVLNIPLQKQERKFIQETRILSKLRHPNIVPIFEVGSFESKPYVVREYVRGMPLRELMDREGIISIHRAVSLALQIWDGISCAHEIKVIHGGLSASSIIIDHTFVPRITDFGVALMAGTYPEDQPAPCCIAPEHATRTPLSRQTDLFFLGLLLYEMLTGRPAFLATGGLSSMIYRVAHDPVISPFNYNKLVDRNLNRIILQALEKNPEDRYFDVQAARKVLDSHRQPEQLKIRPGEMQDTVEFLKMRMHHEGDLPAFSQHVVEINNKLSSFAAINFSSAGELARIILQDFSLTNKLLKVVNSALYANLSGKVTTISKAVFLLGIEKVRMMAAALMAFDHLENVSQAAELKEISLYSFLSGIVASDIAKSLHVGGTEEIFICAMLHNLGKILVICYFPEEYDAIKIRMPQYGGDERRASKSVLGVSYSELGIAISRSWNFPDTIISSMETLPPGSVERPGTDQATVRVMANFANELLRSPITDEDGNPSDALFTLSQRYQNSIPLPPKKIASLVEETMENLGSQTSMIVSMDSGTIDKVKASLWKVSATEPLISDDKTELPEQSGKRSEFDAGAPESIQMAQMGILDSGLEEINATIIEGNNLNEAIHMILETMYRGFGFDRVIYCMCRNGLQQMMTGLFGLGIDEAESLKNFTFFISGQKDIFNLAVSQAKGITIDDASAPNVAKITPKWYREFFAAPSFLIYPLIVKGRCFGMLYGDRKTRGTLLSETQLGYMEELRCLAIKAAEKEDQ